MSLSYSRREIKMWNISKSHAISSTSNVLLLYQTKFHLHPTGVVVAVASQVKEAQFQKRWVSLSRACYVQARDAAHWFYGRSQTRPQIDWIRLSEDPTLRNNIWTCYYREASACMLGTYCLWELFCSHYRLFLIEVCRNTSARHSPCLCASCRTRLLLAIIKRY